MRGRKAGRRRALRAVAGLSIAAALSACAVPVALPAPSAERPCPPWVEFSADPHSNAESPYLGCSNEANLRTMAEDPQDLEQGRALGPANGARESIAVGQYERGQVRPLPAAEAAMPTFSLSGAGGGAMQ